MAIASRIIETKTTGEAMRSRCRNIDAKVAGHENHTSSRNIEPRGGYYAPLVLVISNVTFTVTKTSIQTNFDTCVTAACSVYGNNVVPPDEGEWVLWNPGSPGPHTPHAHNKTGLTTDKNYCIRIYASITGSDVWSPSETGYYVVKTQNAGGTGGGLIQIVS